MSRVIISGGGTGGHIFPAIAIGNALKSLDGDCELLFVGARGRMEMTRIPEAGYEVVGLPIIGLPRSKNPLALLKFLFALLRSYWAVRKVIRRFKPDAVVGVGGYASAPTLMYAQRKGIPTVLQEQNGFAGKANRMLAKKAKAICVAYEHMGRFFPQDRVVLTGNPVRAMFCGEQPEHVEAKREMGIDPDSEVVLLLGGSLGARSINYAVRDNLSAIAQVPHITFYLQCGAAHIEEMRAVADAYEGRNLIVTDFISGMDVAYAAADVIVSRAGACAISELCLIGKPVVLIPSPNVAEDHQTRNAEALSTKDAAILLPDAETAERLVPEVLRILTHPAQGVAMSERIRLLALPHANTDIAKIVLKLIEGEEG